MLRDSQLRRGLQTKQHDEHPVVLYRRFRLTLRSASGALNPAPASTEIPIATMPWSARRVEKTMAQTVRAPHPMLRQVVRLAELQLKRPRGLHERVPEVFGPAAVQSNHRCGDREGAPEWDEAQGLLPRPGPGEWRSQLMTNIHYRE